MQPSLPEARALAAEHNLIPLRHSFIEDCETPVSAFLKLRELAPGEPAFLLGVRRAGPAVGRYSFIGFRPRAVLRWSLADGGDPYALAAERRLASARRRWPTLLRSRAAPWASSATTWCARSSRWASPTPTRSACPDMALMLTDVLVVFDHLKHTVTILANADLDAEPDVERAYAAAVRRSPRCAPSSPAPSPEPRAHASWRRCRRFESNMTRERSSRRWWRASSSTSTPGDAFQVVPSQRWSAAVPVEAFSIYRGLRAVNPSPYMYFLDFGDFQVAGASPEPLLTVNGRHVSTKPIAGTRHRGATPEEDRRIARSCWPTRRSAPST